MEFRDLKIQYYRNKDKIDDAVRKVMESGSFIGGESVEKLERRLAAYVGTKYCITCANGTDALQLALMVWGIGEGDVVYVPDFTFFSTGEVVPWVGGTPAFVDIDPDTFNISAVSLEQAIQRTLEEGRLRPKAIIAVDLFGRPADFPAIKNIAKKYHLLVLEDGAQGFGGRIREQRACSFGDISTTSFFPAKPLGCYGDGGAVFTDNDEWAELIRSYKIHGKGKNKYDNIRLGMNSRLDTIQAAILNIKLDLFEEYELEAVNKAAAEYEKCLSHILKVPVIAKEFYSSWAQYTILTTGEQQRELIQSGLRREGIPSMIYYPKGLHKQEAMKKWVTGKEDCSVTEDVSKRCLSLPMHPYLSKEEIERVSSCIERLL